ncbi:hypothetical protein AB0442_19575 [Kitasatospora sp. NPDC085895]|uniref:hypothetical protein n=1 Tax=Kitasatospora sp. NPDC085895 TaxID=3155057 RepID=UPI00344C736D
MTDTSTPPGTSTPQASAPRYRVVELAAHRNNQAATRVHTTGAGGFNVWRNSFPAEHLPPGGSEVEVGGVPFSFPPVGEGDDNVRCDGQFVEVPAGRYDWIHLLAAAERRTEDTVELHYADGSVDSEWLRVSDFWSAPAWFGELPALRTPVMHYPYHVQPGLSAHLWAQRVPVPRRTALAGLRLPRNIAVHLFAATVQEPPPGTAGLPATHREEDGRDH